MPLQLVPPQTPGFSGLQGYAQGSLEQGAMGQRHFGAGAANERTAPVRQWSKHHQFVLSIPAAFRYQAPLGGPAWSFPTPVALTGWKAPASRPAQTIARAAMQRQTHHCGRASWGSSMCQQTAARSFSLSGCKDRDASGSDDHTMRALHMQC